MPSNKNALIRYKFLDRLLSDRHHFYDRKTLWEKVNEMLFDAGFKEVTRRCIETDIIDLMDAPFNAPIEKYIKNGKECLRYKRGFSIFKEELSWEERKLLSEMLSTIGQFDGLDNFEWFDKFNMDLDIEERKQIISFSNNPYLQNSNLLGTLFDLISNEVVINLAYHTFTDATIRSIDFHPYLLKQYNSRWFLLGAADSDMKILTFALDRIDEVKPLPEKKYIECTEDLYERFEDIVGVTLYEDRPIEHVLFWVSDASKEYVITKPIHESQIQYQGEKVQKLHTDYPSLEGGAFFSIDCIRNYELIRELCSFGKDLIVLQPSSIQDEIFNRIREMNDNYTTVRT
ncbi:MAG: WYL domain-containing protein [Bacteroidaceae bacterium]|nr:WYL domain-containing protein [Bacteroidaceae bacterium]